jgi:integrase/recombinase XerC
MTLDRYRGTPYYATRLWMSLTDEQLRLEVLKTLQAREWEVLWTYVEAYLRATGAKKQQVSKETLRKYHRYVLDLLELWQGENLLKPHRNAGNDYLSRLQIERLHEAPNKRLALEVSEREREGEGAGYSRSAISVRLAAGKLLYNALRYAGVTEANPFEHVRVGSQDRAPEDKRKHYTAAHLTKLLKVVDDPAEEVIVLLGAHAGLRIHEMAKLRWRHLRLEEGEVVILGKGRKQATVALSEVLAEALTRLKGRPEGRKRYLTKTGARDASFVLPWRELTIRERFRKLCARAGVPYQGREVHGLRHAAGTQMYLDTGDIVLVADHLRHSQLDTARTYAKRAKDATRQVVRSWGRNDKPEG